MFGGGGTTTIEQERLYKVVKVDAETGESAVGENKESMSDYVTDLLDRYRKAGVLVDTNLLLLYLVGTFDGRRFQDSSVLKCLQWKIMRH